MDETPHHPSPKAPTRTFAQAFVSWASTSGHLRVTVRVEPGAMTISVSEGSRGSDAYPDDLMLELDDDNDDDDFDADEDDGTDDDVEADDAAG